MAVMIGRPINGITINGLEYVLDENGDPMKWATEEQARQFLADHGIGEKEIERTGIEFEEEEEYDNDME